MVVNLNCQCKVQLNDFGKAIWLSQIEALPENILAEHPELPDLIKSRIEENNILTGVLWEIMSIFGPYINLNSIPFTTTTIELNRNPDFKNFFNLQNEEVKADVEGTEDSKN